MGKIASKFRDDDMSWFRAGWNMFYMHGRPSTGKTSLLFRFTRLDSNEQPDPEFLHYADYSGEVTKSVDGAPMYGNMDNEGGRKLEGRLLTHQLEKAKGVIYVMNSTVRHPGYLAHAMEKFEAEFLTHESLRHLVIMIAANKQDLEGAMTPQEIEDIVKNSCNVNRRATIFVMPTSAVTGEGVKLALYYFIQLIKFKDEKVLKPGLIPRAWEQAAGQMEKRNFESILIPEKTRFLDHFRGENKKTFLKTVKKVLSY